MNVITVYWNKMNIQLDMYQTLAIAVVVLILGQFLKSKIDFLEKFCIPAPVVGGLLFAIFTCICYATGLAEFSFDDTLREVCMVFFFTSVGFQANLKVLKSGGKSLIIFLALVVLLIIFQNSLAVGVSKLLGLDPLIGLCTGSIPMVGGHGTAGAFVAVDLERVDDRRRVALAVVDAVAADERVNPQEQLVVGKGLDEIVVAAAAVGVAHVGGLGLRRQKQDRRDAVPPDLRAGGHAVHAGHHDVENDEVIVRLRAHELHGAQAVFGLVNLVAARREQNV